MLLLVVPDDVPPLVSEGTLAPNDGTPVPNDGTFVPNDGTVPGSAGTDGTVGPVVLAVPAVFVAGGVMTVVTPDTALGGMTVVEPAAAPLVVVVGVVGVVVPVDEEEVPIPVTMRGTPPSGSTQFTSRFEQ